MMKILLIASCLMALVSCGYPAFPEEHITLELDVTSKAHQPKVDAEVE